MLTSSLGRLGRLRLLGLLGLLEGLSLLVLIGVALVIGPRITLRK